MKWTLSSWITAISLGATAVLTGTSSVAWDSSRHQLLGLASDWHKMQVDDVELLE